MKAKNDDPKWYDNVEWSLVILFIFIVMSLCGVIWLKTYYPDYWLLQPLCDESCQYKQTYDCCIAREDLTIEQCHDIALESVN